MSSNTRSIQRLLSVPRPNTPALVITKIIFCIMPIVQIVTGALHLNDCPRQRYIPIYLIVVGVFAVMLVLCSFLPCSRQEEGAPPNPLSRVCGIWNSLTSMFLLCWFIAGNVWVYSIYQPNFDKSTTHLDPYCDKSVYQSAFWTITMVYILMAVSLAASLISAIFIRPRKEDSDEVEGQTGAS